MALLACCSYFTNTVENELFAGNKQDGDNYFRTKDLYEWFEKPSYKPKGIILGSSTAALAIDPLTLQQETNINFFNCASAGQNLELSYILLKQATSKTNIKHILLDISPIVWEEDITYPTFDWISNNSAPQNKYVLEMAWRANQLKLWNCFSYYFIKRLLPNHVEYKIEETQDRQYVSKGQNYITRNVAKKQSPYIEYNSISEKNTDGLQNIIRHCKEHNIQLMLLHSVTLNAKVNWDVVKTGNDIPVIKAEEYNIDTSCFYDSHHLYGDCTAAYTQWIGQEYTDRLSYLSFTCNTL